MDSVVTKSSSASTFAYARYATLRPSYSAALYKKLVSYHRGSRKHCLDLGTGHGTIARALASNFERVTGVDPSNGMLVEARRLSAKYPNIHHLCSPAESLSFMKDGGADMVVSGTAAHWFSLDLWLAEMARVVRKGGTLAVWCYAEPAFVGHPEANKILEREASGREEGWLKGYWSEGTRRCVEKYADIIPPDEEWGGIVRTVHHAGRIENAGEVAERKSMKIKEAMDVFRTWSAVHKWCEQYRDRKARNQGGGGDVIDCIFDEIWEIEKNPNGYQAWLDSVVELDWGTGLLMARKK